jgi:hypothetical protein
MNPFAKAQREAKPETETALVQDRTRLLAASMRNKKYIACAVLTVLVLGSFFFQGCKPESENASSPSTNAPPIPDNPKPVHTTQPPKINPGLSTNALPGPVRPRPAQTNRPPKSIDEVLNAMDWGNIAFNAPTAMNLKDTARIQLLLSLNQSIDTLRREITNTGVKEGARIRVSDVMVAHLTSPTLQVTAITPEQQAISSSGETEWGWAVKATTRGSQYLYLTLTAQFQLDGMAAPKTIKTFDKTIQVQVTWKQSIASFVGKNWQWLWAVLFVPLAGWLWKRKSRPIRR